MKIKFKPFTNEELYEHTSFSRSSIAYTLCTRILMEVYHLSLHDAKAIVDDCCLTHKPLILYLRPLMESNPELFI